MLRRFDPRRGLFLGHDATDGFPLYLDSAWLETGVHIMGRTGSGKTRLLLGFLEQLIGYPNATVIVINPKGALGSMVRDATIAAGQSRRLIVFDPADTGMVCGYNPLRPNGLKPHIQAKAARDAILASVGQTSLDQTQQLARFMYLALAAARLCELTLVEALELLLPTSEIRPLVLRRLTDPHLVRALTHFDSLRDGRQDELAASTIARLEAFVSDPTIRSIAAQQTHALDLGAIIDERRILIANLELYNPLRPNEVKMLGRLLVNDVLAHTFGRRERSPVFLVIDEVELFATSDLCAATDLGREMGLRLLAAHQNLEQLTLEDDNRKLRAAMLNNAVTKILCGAPSYEDLRVMGPELFVDEFNARDVKHDHLELDPVEETRTSIARSATWSSQRSESVTETDGLSDSESESTTVARGASKGLSASAGDAETESDSDSFSESYGDSEVVAHSEGRSNGSSDSSIQTESIIPRADAGFDIISGSACGSGSAQGSSSVDTVARGTSHTVTGGHAKGRARTTSAARTASHSEDESEAHSHGTTETRSRSTAVSNGTARQRGGGVTVHTAPWLSYRKRRLPTAFWSFDEYLLTRIQEIRRQDPGFFVVKVPTKPAAFVRAPYVKAPWVSDTSRTRAVARMHELPCYGRADQVSAEAALRLEKLRDGAGELPQKHKRRERSGPDTVWEFRLPEKKVTK